MEAENLSDGDVLAVPHRLWSSISSRFHRPTRPAGGFIPRPASGRYAAASNQQISEPQQQRQPLRVLGQTPIAHLGVSEVPLHVQERMLHFGTH